MADTWFPKIEHPHQFRKTFPVVAAPLTTAIERFEKNPLRMMKEVLQTVEIPSDTVVVVIPAQLGIQLSK